MFVDVKHVKLCGTIIWKWIPVYKFPVVGLYAGRARVPSREGEVQYERE